MIRQTSNRKYSLKMYQASKLHSRHSSVNKLKLLNKYIVELYKLCFSDKSLCLNQSFNEALV